MPWNDDNTYIRSWRPSDEPTQYRMPTPQDWYMRSMANEYAPDEVTRSNPVPGPAGLAAPTIDPMDILGPALATNLAKGLAYYPVQYARHQALKSTMPELAEAFTQMGSPFTKARDFLAGIPERILPQQGQWAPAMAEVQPKPGWTGLKFPAGDILGKYNYNIPYVSEDLAKYPQVVFGRRPEDIAALYDQLGLGTANPGLRGFYTSFRRGPRWAGELDVASRESTLKHELFGHNASKRVRGWGDASGQPLEQINWARSVVPPEDLKQTFLNAAQDQRAISDVFLSNYNHLSPERMGEELWARYVANQAPVAPLVRESFEGPFEEKMGQIARSLVHPALKQNRPTVPAPQGVLTLLRDYLLRPQISGAQD